MSRTIKLFLVLGLALSLALAACAAPAPVVEEAPVAEEAPAEEAPAVEEAEAPAEEAPATETALKVTGSVANEQAWTEDEVKSMSAIDVEATNSKGEADTYTGVLFTDLLAEAQPNADASTVVFVADDGYTAELSLEDLNACADCIVSFRSKGGFSTVMPGYEGSLQVKGVVEIQVK